MVQRWLIVKLGDAIPDVRSRRGDYDALFVEGLGLDEDAYRTWDPRDGAAPPRLDRLRAIVATGSSAMVTDHAPFSEAAGAFLARAAYAGVPVLGVCFGHQLLASALGGEVGDNPAGREVGTVELALKPGAADDPLFAPLGAGPLTMQASHRQRVLRLPEGAELLASSALDPFQAFRFREVAYGVQFHPEFDDDVVRDYVHRHAEACRAEGRDPDAMLAAVRPSGDGRALLASFRALVEAHVA